MNKEFDVFRKFQGKYKGGLLVNWYLNVNYNGELYIWGNVYDDIRWADGDKIHTSAIVNLYKDESIVETVNTYYTLGKHRPVSLEKINLVEYEKSISTLSHAI